jgi:hypothetical protein
MATILLCASVFQRRSRSGFLDELETVRGEALTAPSGEVATAVAMADAAEAQDRLNGAGDDGLEWSGWPGEDDMDDDTDQIWTEPSPHPIRPHEMWHAGGGQSRLADIGGEARSDHDAARALREVEANPSCDTDEMSSSVGDGTQRRFARFRPVDGSDGLDESERSAPSAGGPQVPTIPSSEGDGLLGGPVRRRTRSGRDRRPLPDGRPLRAHGTEPDDHSPLAEAPLPPAAAAAPVTTAPVPPTPKGDPAETKTAPRTVLAIDDRSELAVGATVVRFGEGSRTSMDHGDDGPVVQIEQGWCWVTTLGEGSRVAVRARLAQTDLTVAAGGRALALVEPDRTAFVVIVAGSATLSRNGEFTELHGGSMVLLSADGAPQIDQAEAEELAADPLVARNLETDASR